MTSRLWRESHLGLNGTEGLTRSFQYCKILPALVERLHHTRDTFQTTSFENDCPRLTCANPPFLHWRAEIEFVHNPFHNGTTVSSGTLAASQKQ